MFFLPPSSIVHLMVNRKMRPICEQYLYHTVDLISLPYRSFSFLKAFALRPDLALLVKQLHVDLGWIRVTLQDLPTLLQPDDLTAPSLAKNLRSFDIVGLNWLSDPTLTRIREVVCQMNLTSLSAISWHSNRPEDNLSVSRAMVSNLRAILQFQPQLEFLTVTGDHIDAAVVNSIETADVPNLKRFQGRIPLATAFLNTASKLDYLDLHLGHESVSKTPFPRMCNGHKIRVLRVGVFLTYASSWNGFERFLASFPNIETLVILAIDWFGQGRLSSYFDSIVSYLHVLPLLRKLEIRGLAGSFTEDPHLKPKDLLKFKECCPNLERFIDTEQREWVYARSYENGRGFDVRLECQLLRKKIRHDYDLLIPQLDMWGSVMHSSSTYVHPLELH
ncbi:hypothetical protein FRC00_008562 [Tulasnella sp. 408]|nr:hypothetical protein FRC00_008562 [Tulasnella sp. 408]